MIELDAETVSLMADDTIERARKLFESRFGERELTRRRGEGYDDEDVVLESWVAFKFPVA